MRSTRSGIEHEHEPEGCRGGASVLGRVPDGVLRYCEGCDRYAVEFGTVFLRLTSEQLSRLLSLASCLLSRSRREPTGGRLGLALTSSSVALMLDSKQLESFHTLLSRGADRAIRTPFDATALETSELVH